MAKLGSMADWSGLVSGPVDIVEVEAHKKLGLVGNAVVNAHGKLVRVRRDLGGGGISARLQTTPAGSLGSG